MSKVNEKRERDSTYIVLWKCRSSLSSAHVKISFAEPQMSESVILFPRFSSFRTSISFLYIFLIWSRDKYLCSSVGCVRLYFWQRSVCTEVWILRTICSSRTLNYLLVYYVSDMYEKHTLSKKIILEHRLECWREKDYDWREQVRARTRKTYRDTIHASSNKIMRRLYPMPIPIFPSMSQWLCYISCPFVRTCFSSQYHPSNFHPYNIPWQEIDSCCWHSFVLPWYNRTCV